MSRKKKIVIFFLSVIVLLLLFATWYQYTHAMEEAVSFQVNTPDNKTKLLIATQSSDFKNAVTNNVVNHFKQDSIFIKVIDISVLPEITPKSYNAILLMHTWENFKPPIEVETFISNSKDYKSKMIVFTTSGKGSYKMDGIDAITGESKLENSVSYTNQIIERLKPLLRNKTL